MLLSSFGKPETMKNGDFKSILIRRKYIEELLLPTITLIEKNIGEDVVSIYVDALHRDIDEICHFFEEIDVERSFVAILSMIDDSLIGFRKYSTKQIRQIQLLLRLCYEAEELSITYYKVALKLLQATSINSFPVIKSDDD